MNGNSEESLTLREFLWTIAKDLTKQDLDALKFIVTEIKESDKEQIGQNPVELMTKLIHRGIVDEDTDNLDRFAKLLKRIWREDLSRKVLAYPRQQGSCIPRVHAISNPKVSSGTAAREGSEKTEDAIFAEVLVEVLGKDAVPCMSGHMAALTASDIEEDSPDYKDSAKEADDQTGGVRVSPTLTAKLKVKTLDAAQPGDQGRDLEAEPSVKAPIHLREYQKELAAPGLRGLNSIICAPTGSGKTYTAGHIIYERRRQAKEQNLPFKALFIVCIRNLVKQQADQLKEIFPNDEDETIAQITDTSELARQIKESDVLVLTAQILINCLKIQKVDIHDFHLLVMDECHHTDLNHPYNQIMRFYNQKKILRTGELPQVIGLTASLGVGQSKDAKSHYIEMCANLDCSCITHVKDPLNKDELIRHNPKPKEDQIKGVDTRNLNDGFGCIIRSIMGEVEKGAKLSPDFHYGTQQYENWVVLHRMEAEENANEDLLFACLALREFNTSLLVYKELQASDALAVLERFAEGSDLTPQVHGRPLLHLAMDRFKQHLPELKELATKETLRQNPMLSQLHSLVKKLFTTNKDAQGIILTRTQNNVEGLLRFIRSDPDLDGVKPDKLVGQSRKDTSMTDTQQERVVDHFRQGKVNLLVATDVAQEGLNIAKCNFVVRYNFVSNEIGTTQSKGRARAINSECYLIVEKSSVNYTREIKNLEQEREMMKALDDIDAIPPAELTQKISSCQRYMWREFCYDEERRKTKKGEHEPSDVTIHCLFCKVQFCSALDMRIRGSNYICVKEGFAQLVEVRDRPNAKDHRTVKEEGNLHCANPACGKDVGLKLTYKSSRPREGYALGRKGVMWRLQGEDKYQRIKKWSEVPFDIEELPMKSPGKTSAVPDRET